MAAVSEQCKGFAEFGPKLGMIETPNPEPVKPSPSGLKKILSKNF